MLLFKVLGGWVRGLYLMGFGGFWMTISYFLSRGGDVSPGPTVMGAGALGGLTFLAGVTIIVRSLAMTSQRSPLLEGSPGWRDDGTRSPSDTGFDPDAAIARYLQNKPQPEQGAEPEVPHKLAPAPRPMPSFGRKQA